MRLLQFLCIAFTTVVAAFNHTVEWAEGLEEVHQPPEFGFGPSTFRRYVPNQYEFFLKQHVVADVYEVAGYAQTLHKKDPGGLEGVWEVFEYPEVGISGFYGSFKKATVRKIAKSIHVGKVLLVIDRLDTHLMREAKLRAVAAKMSNEALWKEDEEADGRGELESRDEPDSREEFVPLDNFKPRGRPKPGEEVVPIYDQKPRQQEWRNQAEEKMVKAKHKNEGKIVGDAEVKPMPEVKPQQHDAEFGREDDVEVLLTDEVRVRLDALKEWDELGKVEIYDPALRETKRREEQQKKKEEEARKKNKDKADNDVWMGTDERPEGRRRGQITMHDWLKKPRPIWMKPSVLYERYFRFFHTGKGKDKGQLRKVPKKGLNIYENTYVTQKNAPWGLNRIARYTKRLNRGFDGPDYDTYQFDWKAGSGAYVYVLDDGIDAEHSDLEGRVELGLDATVSLVKGVRLPQRRQHGTHVASVIGGVRCGVAKNTTLIDVKVLRDPVEKSYRGNWNALAVRRGLAWAIRDILSRGRRHNAVINLSLGFLDDGPDMDVYCHTIDSLITDAVAAGIMVVVASGDDPRMASRSCPGRVAAAVTAAAVDIELVPWRFGGNRPGIRHPPDIWAPGVNTIGAKAGTYDGFQFMNGTDMAAAHVSGTAAYMQGLAPNTIEGGTWAIMLYFIRDTLAQHDVKYYGQVRPAWGGPPSRLLNTGQKNSFWRIGLDHGHGEDIEMFWEPLPARYHDFPDLDEFRRLRTMPNITDYANLVDNSI